MNGLGCMGVMHALRLRNVVCVSRS